MHLEDVKLTAEDETFLGVANVPAEATDQGVLVIPGAGHGPMGDVFDQFAEAAAADGYEVARFETWQNQSELDDKSTAQLRAEIVAGTEFLRERDCSTVAVVGKSFGGRLALEHATDVADRLVLWAPAIAVGDHEDSPSITTSELADIDTPTRVLQGDEDAVVPMENSAKLAEHLPAGELVALPGETHSFQTHRGQIVKETIEFL